MQKTQVQVQLGQSSGIWRSSSSSPAFAAFQTRNVTCSINNGKLTFADTFCEAILRPKTSRSCFNRKCRGRWTSGKWSKVCFKQKCYFIGKPSICTEMTSFLQCSASCGDGARRRQVQCVWKTTGEAAEEAVCNELRKPAKVDDCNLGQCPQLSASNGI